MLEQQHSHQRVTQEISKGCYKHCKALTIYISLIFIKVIMLGPDGVCVCVCKEDVHLGLKVQKVYQVTESTLYPLENCPLLPQKGQLLFPPQKLDKRAFF